MWDRVTILATDTQYAKDLVTEFGKSWVGEQQDSSGRWVGSVAYSDTIRIGTDGEVDQDSIKQALEGVPTGGSRIILLVAHSQHAFEVLEQAYLSDFQPDTIWVGPSAWVGREAPRSYSLPPLPGYMGVAPFRNRDQNYQSFIADYQAWLSERNKPFLDELPGFAAETVDAIIAMTKAVSYLYPNTGGPAVYPDRNGTAIVRKLRELDFDGISGRVQFTSEGDRKDPQYTFLNAQARSTHDGSIEWKDVGSLRAETGTVSLNSGEVLCFAKVGCDPPKTPEDSYPVPPVDLPNWVIVIIVVLLLLFVLFAFKYWRSHTKKRKIKAELDAFRNSIVGMRAAERDHVPTLVTWDIESGVEQSLMGQSLTEQSLPGSVAVVSMETSQWCWKETAQMMNKHDCSDIHGDPADCWITYEADCNAKLEEAFKAGKPEYSPLPGYVVNFKKMEQTKLATNFKRDVKRVLKAGGAQAGRSLPSELKGEPQMVLIAGDVVQISTQRDDGWAFGTK